jgi:DNA repair exonuclease SbcCD nuclease subunit
MSMDGAGPPGDERRTGDGRSEDEGHVWSEHGPRERADAGTREPADAGTRERAEGGELRLLAIGDVHLGTRPSRLPEAVADAGLDPLTLAPEAALAAAVECAIDEDVAAVLFAGDVVERTNARYEALRPLEAAIRRLEEASIPVLAVVGNHDVEALPRLARLVDGLELLGEGGRWSARLIERAGCPSVEVVGWSFPRPRVPESPIAALLRDPLTPARPGIVRLGLLHADLDASGGPYAPISSRDLATSGLDAWLLGHVHVPSLPDAAAGRAVEDGGPRGYLGSLVGLDPTETGPHGPWRVRITPRGEVVTEQIPLAPLRWDRFDLEVGEDESPEDVADRLVGEATRFARSIQASGEAPRALGLRPRLVGRTRRFDAFRRALASGLAVEGSVRTVGETLVFIDRVLDDLELAHDLEVLARGDDPPAILARKLLALERPGEQRRLLLDAAREALGPVAADQRWSMLHERRGAIDPLSDESLAALLGRSGRAALCDLLAQREDGAGVDA